MARDFGGVFCGVCTAQRLGREWMRRAVGLPDVDAVPDVGE